MKRSGFKPSVKPLSGVLRTTDLPKPRKPRLAAKPKMNKCQICKGPFIKRSMGHVACKQECAEAVVRQKREKEQRLAEKLWRFELKQKQLAATPIEKFEKAAEAVINRYVRVRDRFYGCISCDKPSHWSGGDWHASHFKSVGSNSALRFHLWNIHKACDQCNWFQAGNVLKYEVRLRLKIGDDKVDFLKNHPRSREYTREYLTRLKTVMGKRLRRMEKRQELLKEAA
jgi:hypothetical protein